MDKILYVFLVIFAIFLVGCDEKKTWTPDLNDTVPADIPIAQSETNTTIDENLPPEPVIEKRL